MRWIRMINRAARSSAVLALLAGCKDENLLLPTQPPAPPPPPVAPPSVTATIGAQGGTIDGPGGVRLAIPPGALPTGTQITIAQDGVGAPAVPTGSAALGPMFSLTPHGLGFGVPVTLRLPAGAATSGAVVLKSNRAGDGWEQLDAVESNGTTTAAITGFSWIGVVCCFPAPRLGGPNDISGVPEGGFWIFNVSAIGAAPFTYQWFRNGFSISGETNRDILLNPVQIGDDGALYSVRVTDRDGLGTTSRAARLGVVALLPKIVSDPTDLQVVAGASATFSAAATSSVAHGVRWERSSGANQPWNAIAGATSTSYTLTNALSNDNNAQFRMRVGNAAPQDTQSVASRAASLTVTGAPVAPSIVTQPLSITVSSGASASFAVVANGTGLDYQWEQATSSGGQFTPIPNATSATFTISNTAMSDNLAAFRVRVSNPAGAALSGTAVLTVLRAPTLALVRVAGGGEHSVGLRGDGRLIAWGGNSDGQLGDGTTTARSTPGPVSGPIASQCSVATFATGWQHNLAICANGDIWSWGDDEFGELGLSAQATDVLVAQRSIAGPARHVAASRFTLRAGRLPPVLLPGAHSMAALANNPLVVATWGANEHGQLGDGLLAQARTPGPVPNLSNVVRVAAGSAFSLALRSDGTVWSWGANSWGQLANGTFTANLRPAPIQSLRNVIAIVAGFQFAMAIDRSGIVYAWGDNQKGQLGDGTSTDRWAAVSVPLPRPAVGIAAGNFHSLALLDDGSVYGWGGNADGAVGVGPSGGLSFSSTPQRISAPLLGNIIAIGAGSYHSLAVDSNYDVWAWGRNDAGQLGDGTMQNRGTPALVANANLR